MNEGLRERKKNRTRQALVDAAVRLFEERGFDAVTTADIAAAADVSPRTFFLHFAAKEDVLFAHSEMRVDLGLRTLTERAAGEPPGTVLARAMERMIVDSWGADLTSGLAALRVRLAASAPALRARLVQRFAGAQHDLAAALLAAYPEELDTVTAAALVGAQVGAVGAAAVASLDRGDAPGEVRDAMLLAAALAAGSTGTRASAPRPSPRRTAPG
ncbi:MAG: putative transcriptional regulator, TetR family [Nonomuraea muscovyensis]|jgi:AcrR family transcriptional regulator|nr:putative transcriptional regulator, TetR family [Nonomuraea muscovyensis]